MANKAYASPGLVLQVVAAPGLDALLVHGKESRATVFRVWFESGHAVPKKTLVVQEKHHRGQDASADMHSCEQIARRKRGTAGPERVLGSTHGSNRQTALRAASAFEVRREGRKSGVQRGNVPKAHRLESARKLRAPAMDRHATPMTWTIPSWSRRSPSLRTESEAHSLTAVRF